MNRIFVIHRLDPIAGIEPIVSRESNSRATASRPDYPVHPVNPCFIVFFNMDVQDEQDYFRASDVLSSWVSILLRVKRLNSSVGLPKLMSSPTSISVAFK